MIFETAAGIKLYYEQYGQGDPLILLHGNGSSHRIFRKAQPVLKNHFTVYALDSRRHGNSSKVKELHYADMAEDVYDFIAGLGIEKPIIFGFSDGAIVALLVAIKHKDALSGVIASGVNADPDGFKKFFITLYRLAYFITRAPLLKLLVTEPHITEAELNSITVPVLVIGGSFDLIKRDHLKYVANAIPNGRYMELKGENHSSYVVNKTKFAKIIITSKIKKWKDHRNLNKKDHETSDKKEMGE
jgi:pimeloyl-ACP methyl ester carboxylesterase